MVKLIVLGCALAAVAITLKVRVDTPQGPQPLARAIVTTHLQQLRSELALPCALKWPSLPAAPVSRGMGWRRLSCATDSSQQLLSALIIRRRWWNPIAFGAHALSIHSVISRLQ
jgi:hypothetical protein